MTTDNIVSLSSRLSPTQEAEVQTEVTKIMLGHLDKIRDRVIAGKTTGLLWVEMTDDADSSGFGMQLGPNVGYVPVLGMLAVAKAFALDALMAETNSDE